MQDFIGCAVLVIVATAIVVAATFRSPPRERTLVLAALWMHFAASIALLWMMSNVFGATDLAYFLDESRPLQMLIDRRPLFWTIEIVKLLFHQPSALPMTSDSTSSMTCVTALGMWLTGSASVLFIVCSLIGFTGKWAIYAALRDELKFADPRPLLVCAMMIPSCVFWTSGIVKEAFAFCGIGLMFRGAQVLLRKMNPLSFVHIVIGFGLVGGFKPFFLFAFVIGVAAWTLFAKTKRLVFAPIFLAIGIVIAVGGVIVLGKTFDEFAVDNVAETLAKKQTFAEIAAEEGNGGSGYRISDAQSRGLGAQVLYAPLALVTTLARPLPFEVHNATSAVESAEVLVMTIFLLQSLRRTKVSGALRNIFAEPVLVFALLFTVISATGVGLATANFGTLSRYRTPVLPFYAALIAGMRRAEKRAAGSENPEPAPVSPALRRAMAVRPARLARRAGPRVRRVQG